jgi:hypothetical protein
MIINVIFEERLVFKIKLVFHSNTQIPFIYVKEVDKESDLRVAFDHKEISEKELDVSIWCIGLPLK